ncbi:FHIPEP family type III secretion protein, partial [Methylobacterium organophilum]|nr:FHIPEP family type III secretion protein [Methylobacterium organophilum]
MKFDWMKLTIMPDSSAAVMLLIALLPGMPMLPFVLLGGGAGYAAWRINKTAKLAPPLDAQGVPMDAAAVAAASAAKEETVTDLLKLDDLKLEMGYALLALVNGEGLSFGEAAKSYTLLHLGVRHLSWLFVSLCSFTTYALSHNIGASVFSGALVRYRA